MKFRAWLFILGLNSMFITPAFSYQETTVTKGGTITGKVTLAGKITSIGDTSIREQR